MQSEHCSFLNCSGWSWLANFFHMMQRGRSGGRDGRILCFSILVLSHFLHSSLIDPFNFAYFAPPKALEI
jgi:hypothetical protein